MFASICLAVLMGPLAIVSLFIDGDKITYMRAFLLSLIMMCWPVVLFGVSDPGSWVYYLVIGICVVAFSIYVVYDMQKIAKVWMYDEYVPAAIMLYFDFAVLFIVLLYLFAKNKK